ncbi:MAG: acyl-CoA synthetase FdrA [Rhodospirillales bacterium]|nr:acyl-CoA synthetase FdrA [Rhodospirillales bacterium]
MKTGQKIFTNMYRDSVALMQLSARLSDLPGVDQASAIMATQANIALLTEAGLMDGRTDAGVNDLLLVVRGDGDTQINAAIAEAGVQLTEVRGGDLSDTGPSAPKSIEAAMSISPGANLVLISCPGEYAGAEAMKALNLGLDVMLFSDNISTEDEVRLKTRGDELGLLVMGPDCGTAILNGVPLGFANVVSRGNIGIVAASGTGLQQVSCLIDKWGGGVSQAIGTGGRDLKSAIGGRTMIRAINLLAEDTASDVIILISKPPDEDVAGRVIEIAAKCGKPVIVNFIGDMTNEGNHDNITRADTLEDAAHMAVVAALPKDAQPDALTRHNFDAAKLDELRARFSQGQISIRGLYSGGTFAYEAMTILEPALGIVHSSSPLNPDGLLDDPWRSQGHTVVDLGDDIFTRGRPHPMIDHRLRNERIITEAEDPETAIILLDVVLGYGAHNDPAGEMIQPSKKQEPGPRQWGAVLFLSVLSAERPMIHKIPTPKKRPLEMLMLF